MHQSFAQRRLVFVIKINLFKFYIYKHSKRTPLMLACTKNSLDIIKYLVEHKADLNQVNKDGWTAFHIAVRYFLVLILKKKF